ncbi:MAG TPA: methyltransferase domain-containing protein [Microthrixaceae bacterium]|nr:methyltransferase domain-containing protein [Microthrixaceae bacterium]
MDAPDGPTDRYTHGHEPSALAAHSTRTAASSAAYLLPKLVPGMGVLDVGCGPGTITLDLARVVAPGEVIGVENVEAPLDAARANAAERGDTTTRFQVADAYRLPFDDDRFDVVHAHQVLQHVTDPVAVLAEMARVCRPDGWVAARDADYAAFAWYPESPGIERWLDTYRHLARRNGAEPDAGRRLRAWAQAAGLSEVTVTTSNWTYATPESTAWWANSQADRVIGEVFTAQAAEAGVSADEVAAMAAGWRSWGADPDAWFLVPHGELLAHP